MTTKTPLCEIGSCSELATFRYQTSGVLICGHHANESDNADDLRRFTDLGKWPRLLVVGAAGADTITPDQAAEILIRTDIWSLSANQADWEEEVANITGASSWRHYEYNRDRTFRDLHRVLPLEYLINGRIASSWIGGLHGWVDWAGKIGCASFNIGKWPTIEAVAEEWTMIAEAWPFLNLIAQLISEEGEGLPVVNYIVANGQVRTVAPWDLICPIEENPVGSIRPTKSQILRGLELARMVPPIDTYPLSRDSEKSLDERA